MAPFSRRKIMSVHGDVAEVLCGDSFCVWYGGGDMYENGTACPLGGEGGVGCVLGFKEDRRTDTRPARCRKAEDRYAKEQKHRGGIHAQTVEG